MMDGVDQNARDGIKRLEINLDKAVLTAVYVAEKAALKTRISETEKDILGLELKIEKMEERAAAGRRLLLASFVLPLLLALILLYVQSQIGATR